MSDHSGGEDLDPVPVSSLIPPVSTSFSSSTTPQNSNHKKILEPSEDDAAAQSPQGGVQPAASAQADEGEAEDEVEIAPGSTRERIIRRKIQKRTDGEMQAGSSNLEDFRSFDISKAMQSLNSDNAAVRRKALQRLHIRWWHIPTEAFTRILKAAGAPAASIADIPGVVQACNICRDWKKPGPKAVHSFRIVHEFNEEVQFGLLFYHSQLEPKRGMLTVVHLCDCCTRFSRSGIVQSKDERTLCQVIAELWCSIFGPMTTLTLDQEAGMRGEEAANWAQKLGIDLRFKAPNQKAWVVERHNEILRQGIHRTEEQLKKDGIDFPAESALSMVTFMKNAITVIGNSTPYQAVLGRQPAMLPPIEGGLSGQYADPRREARVREIAAANIWKPQQKPDWRGRIITIQGQRWIGSSISQEIR